MLSILPDGSPDPRTVLADAFTSRGPAGGTGDDMALFGRFVGSWDLEVTDVAPDGAETTVAGEWHFGWALAGRAVADVWIAPRRSASGASPGEHGASLRFPDPTVGGWRSTWVGPGRRLVRTFVARPDGGEIVLASDDDGPGLRWVFSDVTTDTFRWRNEVSTDDGHAWRVQQRFAARRCAPRTADREAPR